MTGKWIIIRIFGGSRSSLKLLALNSSQQLSLASSLAECGVNPTRTLRDGLPVAAKTLTLEQFYCCLESATRLGEQKIDPSPILQYGLPIIAQIGSTLEDFSANLLSIEDLAPFLKKCGAGYYSKKCEAGYYINYNAFQDTLLIVAQASTTPDAFQLNIGILKGLVTHLIEAGINLSGIVSRLAELTMQAIAIKQHYEDFEPTFHREIAHEKFEDYYLGGQTHYTVIDHPSWVELRPIGRRTVKMSLPMVKRILLEKLLAQRSWLWQFPHDLVTQERVRQERALERITTFYTFLPSILDRLTRHGVIGSTAKLRSAYLIGSYAWVVSPNDIDLFLLLDGKSDVVLLTDEVLKKLGVQIPEMRVPMAVEMVGYETLLAASRGESIPNRKRLAFRHTLLYGSVLLAGHDLFKDTPARLEALENLWQDLDTDRQRADWPKLKGDRVKIAQKEAWRQIEADALAMFIRWVKLSHFLMRIFHPTKDDIGSLFKFVRRCFPFAFLFTLQETEEQGELNWLTMLFVAGFRDVAQALVEGQGQPGLQEFQERFGIDFLSAYKQITAISKGLHSGFERKRQKSARTILAAGPSTQEIKALRKERHRRTHKGQR